MYERLFSKSGLSLDRLRALVEVQAAGSIAKAAGSDPIRQSQYSRQLKELEGYFGIQLTRRSGRTLSVTPEGRELCRNVRDTLATLEDFIRRAEGRPCSYAVGAGDSILQWLLLPTFGDMRTAFPNVQLVAENLRSAEVQQRLRDRSLDFGIVREFPSTEDLCQATLGVLRYRLFVPKALLPPAQGAILPASALAQLPVALLRAGVAAGDEIRRALHRKTTRLNVVLETDSFTELLPALGTRRCAVVLPSIASSAAEAVDAVGLDLAALEACRRKMALCWSSRLESVRPEATRIRRWMLTYLKI